MTDARQWPQEAKQSLRFLAAARHFLPADVASDAELDRRFADHVRRAEFQPALEALEALGMNHGASGEELQFWKELYYAAQHLGLSEHAARYEEQVRQVVAMQRLQF